MEILLFFEEEDAQWQAGIILQFSQVFLAGKPHPSLPVAYDLDRNAQIACHMLYRQFLMIAPSFEPMPETLGDCHNWIHI